MTDRDPRAVPPARQEGTSKRGPYAKGLARRQQIINEVLAVYDRLGFEGTSLRAIGEAIGVTHPVLKHHFGTREQLFIEVLREYDRRFLDARDVGDGTFVDLIHRSTEHSLRTPGLMALLNSMVAHALEAGNDHSRAHFSERYAELRGNITELLAEGQEAGTVRSDIPLPEAASLVLAAADGLSTQWLLDGSADIKNGLLLLQRLLEPPDQQVARADVQS
ncbi:TetR/AcrR family transcriptional regulator [Micromonospora craniellae]|uniref:TetR/AcrR family transcriptional regulator n=1 Tax=Micromonospora craniellae TaxID=2294034 RepID=A0A372FVC3_9ACTN|nr:TetR/AcrR family transcriptional regulator [Micromonospora craniellae]QOC89764.1 TetR/AcrR family transcriptional regulator [Micromonospora craniellae]RFS44516.1 TetR/AcrR family transcriptional regulator [Micromonospora craniellae]